MQWGGPGADRSPPAQVHVNLLGSGSALAGYQMANTPALRRRLAVAVGFGVFVS